MRLLVDVNPGWGYITKGSFPTSHRYSPPISVSPALCAPRPASTCPSVSTETGTDRIHCLFCEQLPTTYPV